jgi:hypothetical protein
MTVEVAAAGHRTLTSYVESARRIHLTGIWNADDYAELLLQVIVRYHLVELELVEKLLLFVLQPPVPTQNSESRRKPRDFCAAAIPSWA